MARWLKKKTHRLKKQGRQKCTKNRFPLQTTPLTTRNCPLRGGPGSSLHPDDSSSKTNTSWQFSARSIANPLPTPTPPPSLLIRWSSERSSCQGCHPFLGCHTEWSLIDLKCLPGLSYESSLTGCSSLRSTGIAVDKNGLMYFVDATMIRKVDQNGIISTLLGANDLTAVRPLSCDTSMDVSQVRREWRWLMAVIDDDVASPECWAVRLCGREPTWGVRGETDIGRD